MPVQPAGMDNDSGVILTVGFFANEENFAIVQPFATDSSALDASNLCSDAVISFITSALPSLLDCLSESTNATFIQAEAMTNGAIPFRDTFGPTDNPGTRTGNPAPTQVAALLTFYADPSDISIGGRMRLAKSFIGGISVSDTSDNKIVDALQTALGNYGEIVQGGFASAGDPASSWYRVCKTPVPRTPGTKITRTLNYEVRGGIYTQKRRLVPRV